MVEKIIDCMIEYFENDVRRINHALKVYVFARSIGKIEGLSETDQMILEISSILHDIGIKVSEKKYNSSSGKYQELEGPNVANDILKQFNIKNDLLGRILHIIGNHHTYSKIDGIDFQILVEADFLVNIYEDSLERDSIDTIKNKYFKTNTGLKFISTMY